jgi:DNA-binding NtrC family response regulator
MENNVMSERTQSGAIVQIHPGHPNALRNAEAIDPQELKRFLEHASALGEGRPPSLKTWLDYAEAWQITRALKRCHGNRSATARALSIGRRTLYAKMEKLGITANWEV